MLGDKDSKDDREKRQPFIWKTGQKQKETGNI
jgi:hypothetical protein